MSDTETPAAEDRRGDVASVSGILNTCRPGEGPPAAEPDPTGKGPHPVIKVGTTKAQSRRPSVGFAQYCLNNFLDQLQAGTHTCKAQTAEAKSFIDQNLTLLRNANALPLAVDCRFGPNTQRATKIFQACFAIDRDGAIGNITWPLLEPFGTSTASPFNLLVDANRDGTPDAGPASGAWTFGASGSGAIVLVNNDDDGTDGAPDNENDTIDSGNDASELAPLTIDRSGPAPVGAQLELRVDDSTHIRIFSSRAAGGTEIIGPVAGATHTFSDLTLQRIDLGMEALRYAGTGFNGEVTITLRFTDAGGAITDQTAVVRVAPWIVTNHVDAAEKVFVVDAGSFNQRFRDDLKPLVTAAGCTLVEGTVADIWMQDCMEFGFANLPGAGVRSVMRAPRNRPLKVFPRTLLDADLGYFEMGTLSPDATYDSTGNLEATPPATSAAGKHFPLGRIYFGPGLAPEVIDPDTRAFLHAQVVQAPIELDTNWLTVGHVDEVLSIVPAPGAVGFKLLVASPELGYRILDSVKAAHPTAKMLLGRTFPTDTAGPFDVEQTVTAFLSLMDTFHPDLADAISSGLISYTPKPLRDYNADRQADIDLMRDTMVAELGLNPVDDVIHIPAIAMPNPATPPLADALVAGMVNMLVVNKHCIVPKPFGPVVGGVDQFEKDVQDKLTPLGLTVNFLDCWDEYHVNLGEVHCGTNTLRAPTTARWWEFQP